MKPAYFVNAGVDFLLVGGLSIGAALAFLGLQAAGRPPAMEAWAVGLAWVVNWPHFAASSWRLYRSRDTRGQYPATAFLAPLLVAGMTAAAFASPEGVAPALVKLYLWWSPFHFSGQTLGVSLLYARRAGIPVGPLRRAALAVFLYAGYAWLVIAGDSAVTPERMDGLLFPRLGLPGWMSTASTWTLYAATALLLAVWGRAALAQPIVLLPAVAQFVWFVVGAQVPSFNLLVPFFHSLQYLLIAGAMQVREKPTSSVAVWGLANVALGAGLFWLLPRLVGLAAGAPLGFALPVLSIAVQIHHFFVDGVIWKLRNPKVGGALA